MTRSAVHGTHKKSEDVAPALLELTIQVGKGDSNSWNKSVYLYKWA